LALYVIEQTNIYPTVHFIGQVTSASVSLLHSSGVSFTFLTWLTLQLLALYVTEQTNIYLPHIYAILNDVPYMSVHFVESMLSLLSLETCSMVTFPGS
jgi:hypothetical protein